MDFPFPCNKIGHDSHLKLNNKICRKCKVAYNSKNKRKRKKEQFEIIATQLSECKKQKHDLEQIITRKLEIETKQYHITQEQEIETLKLNHKTFVEIERIKTFFTKPEVNSILVDPDEDVHHIALNYVDKFKEYLKNDDRYTTPMSLFKIIVERAHIDESWYDLYCVKENKKLRMLAKNTLAVEWNNLKAYINPPFTRGVAETFINKALNSLGSLFIVLLLNSGSNWFSCLYKENLNRMLATPIWGRVKFGEFTQRYMYPIMIVEIHSKDLNVPFSDFSNICTIDLDSDPYLGLSSEFIQEKT